MIFTQLNIVLAIVSAILFLLVSLLNELVFHSATYEFVRGMNWIYLPAGVRLLCTLLFGGAGAVGIFISSWVMSIEYFFPNDPMRAFGASIASALAPYLIYKAAQQIYGLQASLTNLNAKRLLLFALACSIANPVLHNVWLFFISQNVGMGFFVMIFGDLLGTLTILYAVKLILPFMLIKSTHA
ncbi:hypothetical protein Q8A64_17380 [Oxalobacteraceae bacterium R-40]|uniref:MASE1 domain-containing protein n=1 Tax=Keguizhuia sedimenti TaxID=3064264 RepID=A0ABU1BUQ9_9BURK|nr:hypothetical protein [Oxalobacteraceae bacterium R-40]